MLNNLKSHESPGYCPKLPPMQNQNDDSHQLSMVQTHLHQKSADHDKMGPLVAINSSPSRTTKPNRIYTNKDGSEIAQEWIEEYQDWLTIKVDDRLESNCELIRCFDNIAGMSTYHHKQMLLK